MGCRGPLRGGALAGLGLDLGDDPHAACKRGDHRSTGLVTQCMQTACVLAGATRKLQLPLLQQKEPWLQLLHQQLQQRMADDEGSRRGARSKARRGRNNVEGEGPT